MTKVFKAIILFVIHGLPFVISIHYKCIFTSVPICPLHQYPNRLKVYSGIDGENLSSSSNINRVVPIWNKVLHQLTLMFTTFPLTPTSTIEYVVAMMQRTLFLLDDAVDLPCVECLMRNQMGLLDFVKSTDPFNVKVGERTLADDKVPLLEETED
ncbi:hypothetical protein Tco_0596402 [Tanacetum coccineum]